MCKLVVKRVSTRRERKQFLEFPWTLYRDDPNWVPPLRDYQKEIVGYRPHPFYHRNRIQTFLACRGGEVQGRIASILNQGHIHRYSERRGFFGFFECVDDQQVANGLFDAVRQWFADQGIYALRGPTNPSLNHELGTLIDGFDSPPTFMMTYNPPYYPRLIEGYGFRKIQDLYAYVGHVDMLPKIKTKLEPIVAQIMEHCSVHLRSLDTSRFLEDVETFLSVYNRSLVNTWGFVPMSKDEVRHSARNLRHLIAPKLTIAAEIEGQVVGASFGLPDYNPRIRQIDGRLFPFGIFRLLRRKHQIKRVRLISTNVIPEYQRMGIGLALMAGLAPMAEKWDLKEAEFSWVLESNFLSRGSLEKGGAKIAKTFRLYDWDGERHERRRPAGSGTQAAAGRGRPFDIREVRDGNDLKRFCEVPRRIYAYDPHWVPPGAADLRRFLSPGKHPFYIHAKAAKYMAIRNGVPLGRLLVSDDPHYNQQHDTNVGCFGMFECVDDDRVAHALLNAAADWLDRQGRRSIVGPVDYSTNYCCGLLVDGFHTPPRVMMNHHRPYYQELLESWGLAKVQDLHHWWFDDLGDVIEKWRTRIEQTARQQNVNLRPLTAWDASTQMQICRSIQAEARRAEWGYVEPTDAEWRYLFNLWGRLSTRDMLLVVEADGRPVGASITVADRNEALPLGRSGHRGFGWATGLFGRRSVARRVRTARMLALDVLEDYHAQQIAEVLIVHTLQHCDELLGYNGFDVGWTLEDDVPRSRALETVGAQRYKTYRIYEKPLA